MLSCSIPEDLETCLLTLDQLSVSLGVLFLILHLGKHPKLPLVFAILYYIILFVPIILHIVWVILLGVNVGANPALPILFCGIFIGILFLPSQSRLFYFKVLALFLAFITA